MWVVEKTSPSPKKHFILFSLLLWPASVQIQERGWGLALPNNMRGQRKQKENKLRHIIKVMRRGTTQREDSFLLFCVSSDIFWTLRTHHYVNELFCILKQEKEESTEKKPKLLPTSSPLHAEKIEKKRWSKVVNKIVGPLYIPRSYTFYEWRYNEMYTERKYHI